LRVWGFVEVAQVVDIDVEFVPEGFVGPDF
jgi:hypothetical protein